MPRMSLHQLHTLHKPRHVDPFLSEGDGLCSTSSTTVRRLFHLLTRYDKNTAKHSLRVRRYSLWLAEELGLKEEQCNQLSLAALLHDIGKITLPKSILNKSGKLSQVEASQMRRHPVIGEWILRTNLPCTEAFTTVRAHHERLDGKGYPDGLRGKDIPLPARILAVADSFDAMTSSRSYNQPLPWRQALDGLVVCTGSQLDAEMVECFTATIRSRRVSVGRFLNSGERPSASPSLLLENHPLKVSRFTIAGEMGS